VGVLAGEVLVLFDGASIQREDSFSSTVAFRVDEHLLDEIIIADTVESYVSQRRRNGVTVSAGS
jgi:hypothetical protein